MWVCKFLKLLQLHEALTECSNFFIVPITAVGSTSSFFMSTPQDLRTGFDL